MANTSYDAIVVGAGWGGLQQVRHLLAAGFSVRCIERDSLLGGTWNWNRYPGARVDIESSYYTVQEPELWAKWKGWSEKYATWEDVLEHVNWYADQYNLREHISFNQDIIEATFSDEKNSWSVKTTTGETYNGRFVIMCTGALSDANVPSYAANFEGVVVHTGKWPKDGLDYKGKRVAVIGTGSSGVQSIPHFAREAEHVTVFQRTPQFVVPLMNEPSTKDNALPIPVASFILNKYPFAINLETRWESYAQITAFGKDKFDEELEKRWALGGFRLIGACTDLAFNKDAEQHVSDFIRNKIRATVKDAETARKLIPNYGYVCKRFLLGTNYYDTFNLPNVSLHSLEEAPLKEMTKDSIITADGKEHKTDILVLATGFDSMRGSIYRIAIRNGKGELLKDKYEQNGIRTFLGLQTAGFPNLFFVATAQSPSVLTNMLWATDQHTRYISRLMTWMKDNNKLRIEASLEHENQWVDHCDAVAGQTLFTANDCKSAYLGSNIEGKRRQFLPYGGGIHAYMGKCETSAAFNYLGFDFFPPVARAPITFIPSPIPSAHAQNILDVFSLLPKPDGLVYSQAYPIVRQVYDQFLNLFNPALGNVDLSMDQVTGDSGSFNVFWLFKKGTNLEEERKKKTLVFYHGGAYFSGGIVMYKNVLDYIVRDLECPVMFVDYKLAPEFPLPVGMNNSFDAYKHLLSLGVDSKHIAIMGDSAGGGMALIVAQKIRDANLPQPCSLVLISPWLDLSLSGESHKTMGDFDWVLKPSFFNTDFTTWLVDGKLPLNDPSVSPLFGDFKNLPPTHFFVGANEILMSDSTRGHANASAAGVKSKLEICPHMFHDHQLFGDMPEAFNCRQSIKKWLTESGFY